MSDFLHLRVYSDFSLLHSALSVSSIIKLCVNNKMPAVSITDKNNMFCAFEFSEKAISNGVQPIIGMHTDILINNNIYNVILIAKNHIGYSNLIKISSNSFRNSSTEPFATLDDITKYSNEIIMLGGTPIGGIISGFLNKSLDIKIFHKIIDHYQNSLYVEIQRHNLETDNISNTLIDFAYQHNLPLVATNNVLFANKDSYNAHDALICIKDGRYISEDNRLKFNEEFHFKSAEEMKFLFHDIPEAIENTVNIAKRCSFGLKKQEVTFPSICEPEKANSMLIELANQGLEKRLTNCVYTDSINNEEKQKIFTHYKERLDYELSVICNMQYASYFLIVNDFVIWSKNNGIFVGPGRGSGAGSLVIWCLFITDIDPIKFGLIFERFLNPERISMPDLDIDFCPDGREKVINYICEKYGKDCVAHIITFGTMQARGILRDVGRVLQMPYSQVDRLCKMIPNSPLKQVTLSEAIELDPNLKEERDKDEMVGQLLTNALMLEGLHRHSSMHAAGIVISHKPLDTIIPICIDSESKRLLTQFSMGYVEKSGLIKFDFLGLKTLSVIHNTIKLIQNNNENFNIEKINYNDKKVYELLSNGNNIGIFQLESSYVIDILQKMKPDKFEDIIALISLNRPGPMDNIPHYIDRKNGKEAIDFLHPMLQKILEETFGIIVYQEQVIYIAQILAGYSMGSADLLRKAMGKKIKEEMDKQKEIFTTGAIKNGVDKKTAEHIFELVAKFAGYGFNKSHAAAYATISFQTAYLKTHYTMWFFISLMSLDINDTNKLFILCRDAELNGITMLSPDVNRSEEFFIKENENSIRYALGACKNIGSSFANEIAIERKKNGAFKDIFNFIERMSGSINKKFIEALIKSGALISIHKNSKQLFESVEILISYASSFKKDIECKQSNMFGDIFDSSISKPALKNTEDLSEEEAMSFEFEAFGFYLKKHPVENYHDKLKDTGIISVLNVLKNTSSESIAMAGVISSMKIKPSKKGKMANILFSDNTGMISCMIYDEMLIKPEIIYNGAVVYIVAKISKDDAGIRVIINKIEPLKEFIKKTNNNITIFVKPNIDANSIKEIKAILGAPVSAFERKTFVYFNITENDQNIKLKISGAYNITQENIKKIEKTPNVIKILA